MAGAGPDAAKFQVLPFEGEPGWKHQPRTIAWFDVQEGLQEVMAQIAAEANTL